MEDDDDLYDCVENEEAEGDEIYEDLMRSEPVVMPVSSGKGTLLSPCCWNGMYPDANADELRGGLSYSACGDVLGLLGSVLWKGSVS